MNPRFAYVIDVFRSVYEYPDVEISYGERSTGLTILHSPSSSVFEELRDVELSNVQWTVWRGRRIPLLFDLPREEWIRETEHGVELSLDVIASCFYFLSNWGEYVSPLDDGKGRFPFKESVQYKLGICELPVVNYYFDILKTALEKLGIPVRARTWGGFPFACFLSHDIDSCQSGWLQGGKALVKTGHLIKPVGLALQRAITKDAWFNFEEIIQLEKSLGAVSTYFFLARNTKVNGLKNADYDIRKPKFRKVLLDIRESGSEIGIHGSLGSHRNEDLFKDDCNRLGSQIVGNRFHFLGFEQGVTPTLLEKCGILYDSTLGFAEQIGFRNGICHPFPLYDHKFGRASTVLEVPLLVMDATLQFPRYMGLLPKEAISAADEILKEVIQWNGVFSVLWHNTHFSDYKYGGWKDVYVKISKNVKEDGGCFLTGHQILNEWRKRSKDDII